MWPDDGSLTEPKHVATLDATFNPLCQTEIVVQFVMIIYNTMRWKTSRYVRLVVCCLVGVH
jgi:hypothetical protein